MEQMKNPLYCTRLFMQRLKSYTAGESWLPDYVNSQARILVRNEGQEKYDSEIVNRYAGMSRERMAERIQLLDYFLRISRCKSAPFLLHPVLQTRFQTENWYADGVDLLSYVVEFPWQEAESFDVESNSWVEAIALDSRFLEPQFVSLLNLCLETWLDTGMVQPNWPYATTGSKIEQRPLIKTCDALTKCGLKQDQRQTLSNRIKKLGLEICPMHGLQYCDVIEVVAKTFVTG